jgi:hypothetical protein
MLKESSVPFRLESPPSKLWTVERMAAEFGTSVSNIWSMVARSQIPRPWAHRNRRALWAPEQVLPFKKRYRRRHGK